MKEKYDTFKINSKGYTQVRLCNNNKNAKTNYFCSLEPTINLYRNDKGNCEETHTGVKTFDIFFV